MSHRPLNLTPDLDQAYGAFGITGVRNPAALVAVRQTGFVWTRQPGVVCLAMTRRYLDMAHANPCVTAVIVPSSLASDGEDAGKALLACEKADELYHQLHLAQWSDASADDRFRIDATAFVDASAILRGDVRVAAGARIGPGAVIEGPVRIGRNARIEAGAVVGCEGLYVKSILGTRRHMPHFGGVEIGEEVHVLAGAVIARSAVHGEDTRVDAGAHVGILSNIGHDVHVGEGATVSSNVVVAGRARIGAQAWIGASATISNMIEIGPRAQVRLGAVVVQDVPEGGDVSGNFALGHARNMRRFLKDVRDGS